jgi:outer membrane protein assembly factor BamB
MLRATSLFLFLVCSGTASAADWPQWLGVNRDGTSPDKVSPWKTAPKALWRVPVGAGFATPVIADGRVFIHARVEGKEAEEVLALDERTGKQLWRSAYPRAPYFSLINTGPQATPAVVLGRVYTFGITGLLSGFDTVTGKQLWQVDVYKQFGVHAPRFGACCSPLVVGNRVLVSVGGTGSAVAAFDTETGAVAWKALDDPISTASPILFTNRTKAAQAALEVVFVNGQGLVALNPFDGAVSWEFALADQPLVAAPSPVAAGDVLLTSSTATGGVGVKLTAEAERLTAARAWVNADLTGYFATPVVADKDFFYMVTTVTMPQPVTNLRCVNVHTGKEQWNRPKVGFFHAGLVRTGNNKLLMLSDAGKLTLLEHDPKGYRELATAPVCGPTFVSPALANGRFYVRDNKELICLQLGE